ncbi:MAG: DUF1292 domain-containing protein [Bacilli bacterium]|mgnify:FL=1|nr:DUF1292 domain-containing protein [Bacilli bacterium]
MINDNEMVVTNADGVEVTLKILFTFDNDERKSSYVVLCDPNNEDEIMVFGYNEETHELREIEDDEEYSECEEVVNCYLEDPKFNEIKQ